MIEFILVMALLAVVVALAAPSLSNFFRGRKLSSEATRFVALTRYGQSRAVSDGVPLYLWLDRQAGTYGLREQDRFDAATIAADSLLIQRRGSHETIDTKEPEFRLAENLRFDLQENVQTNGRIVMIRFLPDGSVDETSLRALLILREESDRSRAAESIWIAQSWDRSRYEIVDKTNGLERLALQTGALGGIHAR